MHAITLVIIYNYVLFGFRSNIILIILYDLQYSDLCVYLIRDPKPLKLLRTNYFLIQTTLKVSHETNLLNF